MEDVKFVNNVKSLILELGCVPGALLSDNYATKDSAEKIVVPVTFGVPISMDPSGNYKGTNSFPLMADTCNHQSNSSQGSRLVGQPSHSLVREIQNNLWTTTSTFQLPNQIQILPKIQDDICQQKATPITPNFSFNSQLESGAEVIRLNPDAWLSPQISSYNSRSGFNCEPGCGQLSGSHTSQNLMEQQILLSAGVHDQINKNLSALSSFETSQLKTNAGLILDPHIGPSEGSKSRGQIQCPLPNPQRADEINLSGMHVTGIKHQYTDSSKVKEGQFHSLVEQLNNSCMFLGEVDQRHITAVAKHNQIEIPPRAQRMNTDMFQALEISYTHPDKHISLNKNIPGLVPDCQNRDSGNQTLLTNAKPEAACARPLGDDLFDILGVDFKNKLLNEPWNNLPDNRSDANSYKNLGENSLALMSMPEVGSDFYSASEGISESDIFSGTGTDHLLDAVVSRAHSASKQRSDDDVSCRTTLTKISSSSSVPSSSPKYGRVSMPDQVQGEFYGLPKHLGKVGAVETNSLKSGCSKDDVGNCSQSTSICGSHISSWVEQGNNVKRDSSLSTAYSKRPDEINKSNRKRLKPGENPRPRPKDRQMIQDRVKELREIVPNGAKVMLFFFFFNNF